VFTDKSLKLFSLGMHRILIWPDTLPILKSDIRWRPDIRPDILPDFQLDVEMSSTNLNKQRNLME
jgi:hypothetical protein